MSHPTEDGADEAARCHRPGRTRPPADRAGRENSNDPIALTGGERLSIEVGDTRWSISASDASSVVRGASIAVVVLVGE